MSEKLHNPDLPAGAIIEHFDDGGALRNDGVRLKPANQNPWYVLATVHGEQLGEFPDLYLHAQNQRIWNGWMCRWMSDGERAAAAEKLGLPVSELKALTVKERSTLRQAFADRLPGVGLPDPHDPIDFRENHFPNRVVLMRYIFDCPTDFGFATFSRDADFRSSAFTKLADFGSALFAGAAKFRSTTFSGIADFRSTTFNGLADFSDGAFKSWTSFVNARFEIEAPRFYQREMHQDTTFTIEQGCWPTLIVGKAKENRRAYRRLRQLMSDLNSQDDEHFFSRQEMRCKAALAETMLERIGFGFYGGLADYGWSFERPFAALLGLWALGVAGFAGFFASPGATGLEADVLDSPLGTAMGLSFGSLFAFLGLNRLYFGDLLRALPDALQFLAGAQSILGFILLFFLGLGLRNRFRLR
jgi:hypothetical protein